MANCPICHTEYREGEVETCQTCGWDLTPEHKIFGLKFATSQPVKLIDWGRQVWKRSREDISKLQEKLASAEMQLVQMQRERDDSRLNKLEAIVLELQDRVAALETRSTPPSQASTPQFSEPPSQSRETQNQPDEAIADLDFVTLYNTRPDRLPEIVAVSETKESIEARRGGTQQFPVLKPDRRGDYWIVPYDKVFYLVPKAELKFNEHKVQAMEAVFECHNYQAEVSSQFELVKPAEVKETDGEWNAIVRGILQFKQ